MCACMGDSMCLDPQPLLMTTYVSSRCSAVGKIACDAFFPKNTMSDRRVYGNQRYTYIWLGIRPSPCRYSKLFFEFSDEDSSVLLSMFGHNIESSSIQTGTWYIPHLELHIVLSWFLWCSKNMRHCWENVGIRILFGSVSKYLHHRVCIESTI